jgi:L-asparaginase
MLILNSGGTFNKRYNSLSGLLEVPYDNYAIDKIIESFDIKCGLAGIIYKDSLDMDSNDRKILANIITESTDEAFIIIHGTDTIDLSAEFLAEVFTDKIIILTGAMKPFEIDNIEAAVNLGMAVGFAKAVKENGVYICMNGHVGVWNKVVKNKALGKFEIVR